MQADGGLRVNSSRRQQVAALTLQERKKAEMAIRRDIAAMQIAETEERIMLAEGTRVEQAKLAHQAEEAQWRERQSVWLTRQAELEAERDGLKAQVEEMKAKVRAANEQTTQQTAEAHRAKQQLLEMHTTVLEKSADNNAQLRQENARLLAQQKVYEEEVTQAEHEVRMQLIEGEEVKKAMAQAVRELVPLRKEVLEQRAQLKEVHRATAQLKHAKEEDQASFMIAKKATARIMRNKHLKTMEVAVKQGREKQKAIEAKKTEQVLQQVKETEAKLLSAEEQHAERLRRQEEEAARRREEMAENLRRQLEGEAEAMLHDTKSEYEQQMENERMAASARLIQTHKKMNTEYKMSVQGKVAEAEKTAAEMLQQYAEDAQQKLLEKQAENDRLASELEQARKGLVVAQAGLNGMGEVVAGLLHERQEGWATCDLLRITAETDRDVWRGEARRLEAELRRTIAKHEALSKSAADLHTVDRATLLEEVVMGDDERDQLRRWRTRANELGEELSALRKAHQDLLMDSRQQQFDLRKDFEKRLSVEDDKYRKLKSDLDALQQSFGRLKALYEKEKAENKRQADSGNTMKQALAEMRAHLLTAQNDYNFLFMLYTSECKMEDQEKDAMARRFYAYELKLKKEAEMPISTLKSTIYDMEVEAARLDNQVRAMKISMGEELEWQRNETKKVKALVESSRAARVAAEEARDEMERLMNEKVAAAEAEMWEVKQAAARECERMLWMVTSEQEEHSKTKQLLSDERHARGLDATEAERMRERVDAERYARLKAEEAKLAAEKQLDSARGELTDSEAQHAEHLEQAMQALTGRLEAEREMLARLDRDARIFQESDDARIASWQAKVDHWIGKFDALQQDRDELQARFDWLLVRWTGREPREQDVQMMAALQEELSRQMHLTAHAVQAAREYKEALRTNDNAYTHLFGLGALLPNDYVKTHNEIEKAHADKGAGIGGGGGGGGGGGADKGVRSALGHGGGRAASPRRPQSARAALHGLNAPSHSLPPPPPGAPQPEQQPLMPPTPPAPPQRPSSAKPSLPSSQPVTLRVDGAGASPPSNRAAIAFASSGGKLAPAAGSGAAAAAACGAPLNIGIGLSAPSPTPHRTHGTGSRPNSRPASARAPGGGQRRPGSGSHSRGQSPPHQQPAPPSGPRPSGTKRPASARPATGAHWASSENLEGGGLGVGGGRAGAMGGVLNSYQFQGGTNVQTRVYTKRTTTATSMEDATAAAIETCTASIAAASGPYGLEAGLEDMHGAYGASGCVPSPRLARPGTAPLDRDRRATPPSGMEETALTRPRPPQGELPMGAPQPLGQGEAAPTKMRPVAPSGIAYRNVAV